VDEHLDDVDETVELEATDLPETGGRGSARPFDADTILDTLVPQSIDWRGTVRRHPIGAVAVVGLVGYLVGRTKGAAIMAGMTAGLSTALTRQLSDVFEGDFFDF
jgi:hypothetical protein